MKTLILSLILTLGLCAQTTINGSRTILGAWDASGATTTKPAKTGTTDPATCAVGEFFVNTTTASNPLTKQCVATNIWGTTASAARVQSLTVFDPVTGDSGRVQVMFPYPVTITSVSCSVKAATSATINLDERAFATPDTAGTAVLTSALACTTTGATSSTFSNAGIAANVPLALLITAVSGTPDTLRVYVTYTVN